ncbi:hypothetical protein [Streptomyces regalis]|nr:hypothetical protein [Streptomyces regalis]
MLPVLVDGENRLVTLRAYMQVTGDGTSTSLPARRPSASEPAART